MMTLEQIQDALKDRRPKMVAQETGLHLNTIIKVRDNQDANPTYRVIEALSRYLQQREVN